MNKPTNPTRLQAIAKQMADERQITNAAQSSPNNGLTNTASIAANECHPDGTAGNASAAMPAERRPTNNGNGKQPMGDVSQWVTSPSGKRAAVFPVLELALCENCGALMPVKRNTGPKRKRFCSTACRVAAHRARHEAEAGEGRAGAAVAVAWLVAIIFAAWFLAPLVSDLAAMRPRLTGAAELGHTAVNQAAPIAPARLVVATPTLAPAAIWPTDQAAAAVPDIAVTFTDSTGCQDCGTVVPAPWQMAPTAAASPTAGAGLLKIEAAGRVWELTPARLVDCINAQQNDQPTGPTCPPNAAKWAGMLGQGR